MDSIIHDPAYENLLKKHILEILDLLSKNTPEFSLAVNIKGVKFKPQLPQSITEHFSDFIIFSLANYTLSTLELHENTISFESGFGPENIASICTIDIYAIFQILLNSNILFVNPKANFTETFFLTNELLNNNYDEKLQKKRSINALKIQSNFKN